MQPYKAPRPLRLLLGAVLLLVLVLASVPAHANTSVFTNETHANTGTCADAATLIHDVQGSGADSPLAEDNVTIEGIVVGDFQEGDGVPQTIPDYPLCL